jgi:ribosome-associated protein
MMNKDVLLTELTYKATRSSGPGGQHVNKTSTRVELYWNLEASKALSEEEKEYLKEKLANRLNKEGVLILSVGATRSQFKNKKKVTDKFIALLEKKLQKPKKRKKAKVPLAVKRKRLADKRINAEKKASRKKPEF